MKTCSRCGDEKPLSEFYSASRKVGHIRGDCKSCNRADKTRRITPEVKREIVLRSQYGITVTDYKRMLQAQGGGCLLCGGTNKSGKRLAVDHCHTTGVVRGLLCTNCNVGLGCFKDSPELMMKAIEYLDRNGGRRHL